MDFNFPISLHPNRVNFKGKILVAHQPECLPWLGFFAKASMGDLYLLFDSLQFVKEHWHNRNKIRIHNNTQWVSIPVLNKSKQQKINEVRIDNTKNWKKKHLNAFKLNYQKSLFFDEIYSEIELLYKNEYEYLLEFNEAFIRYGFDKFNINIPIIKSSQLEKEGYQLNGKKTDLILNLCDITKTDAFVFGNGGHEYVDKNKLNNSEIEFIFQDYKHPTYNQSQKGNFYSHMSFLDLLFNYGKESYKII